MKLFKQASISVILLIRKNFYKKNPLKDQELLVSRQKVSIQTGNCPAIICKSTTSQKCTLIERQNFTMFRQVLSQKIMLANFGKHPKYYSISIFFAARVQVGRRASTCQKKWRFRICFINRSLKRIRKSRLDLARECTSTPTSSRK